MKHKQWMCAAVSKTDGSFFCKKLIASLAIDRSEAVAQFKRRYPGLRHHAAMPVASVRSFLDATKGDASAN